MLIKTLAGRDEKSQKAQHIVLLGKVYIDI